MIECPCKKCEKRHLGCHSNCQDYISWVEEKNKNKEQELLQKEVDYYYNSLRRTKKYRKDK